MANVTVIPATRNLHTGIRNDAVAKRKTAGYARVSTDSEEQLTSYEAQVDYYTNYIKSRPEWEFVNVYTDEGISATDTRHRDGFNKMVQDALDGKIDLIVTKSVSRFARNTVDSLTTVRKLKEKGVEVYFQKENIYTLDSKGELLITIMSSLAQEESRSISENVTWGKRKRFADGKMSLGYSHFLGYKKGAADGEMEIVEEEAVIVRRIYAEFLAGKSTYDIAARLTEDGVPTPAKKTVWHASTVDSILHNEKYKGDAILQKRFTVDFLSKKTKKNEGEYPQYYIENNHPAIIRPEVFEMVQEEFRRRQAAGGHAQCKTPFSGRIVCADCGGFYGRKVWHAGSKYAKVHWHCNNKFQKRRYCSTPTLKEESIEDCFVAGSKFAKYKDRVLDFKELLALPVISLEKNTSTRTYMDGFLAKNQVEITPEFELATSDMIVQFAVRNLGIGCVVKEFAADELAAGRLFELRFGEVVPPRGFYVAEKRKVRHSRAAEALLSILD